MGLEGRERPLQTEVGNIASAPNMTSVSQDLPPPPEQPGTDGHRLLGSLLGPHAKTGLLCLVGIAVLAVFFQLARGILGYILLLALPGFILYFFLRNGKLDLPADLYETVFASSILGICLFLGIGWSLDRSGLFFLPLVVAGIWAIVLPMAYRRRRELAGLLKSPPRLGWKEPLFLLGFLGGSIAIMAPIFMLQQGGGLIGTDTPVFSLAGSAIASTGSWPNISTLWQPLAPPSAISPGLPLLYALFQLVTGVPSIYASTALLTMFLFLTGIGFALVFRRLGAGPRWSDAFSALWLLGCAELVPTLILNWLLEDYLSGAGPDTLLAIPMIMLALCSMLRFPNSKATTSDTITIGIVSAGVLLTDQLSFLILAALVLGYLLVLAVGRNWRHLLATALSVVAIPVLFFPPALNLSRDVSISPLSSQQVTLSLLTTLGPQISQFTQDIDILTIAAIGIFLVAIFRMWQLRRWKDPVKTGLGLTFPLALAFIITCYVTSTDVGQNLLGIGWWRFEEFAPIFLLPIAVFLLFKIRTSLRSKRATAAFAIIVVSCLIAAGGFEALQVPGVVQQCTQSSDVFGPNEIAAAEWLSHQGPSNAVVVTDLNDGSSNVVFVPYFAHHPTESRDKNILYLDLYDTPYPYNLPAYYANLLFTDPTATNVLEGNVSLNFTYIYLETPWDGQIIDAFSQLAYLPVVYQNPSVFIYKIDPALQNRSYFVPAVNYTAASDGVDRQHSGGAFNSPVSLPSEPNIVSSKEDYGSAFDGNFTSYQVNITDGGGYLFRANGDVFHTSEYLDVMVNGVATGMVNFSSKGWTSSSTLGIDLPAGNDTIKLVFEGTVGWGLPLDYFTLDRV